MITLTSREFFFIINIDDIVGIIYNTYTYDSTEKTLRSVNPFKYGCQLNGFDIRSEETVLFFNI